MVLDAFLNIHNSSPDCLIAVKFGMNVDYGMIYYCFKYRLCTGIYCRMRASYRWTKITPKKSCWASYSFGAAARFLNHRNFTIVRLFPTKFGVKIVHDSTYPRCKFGYDRTIFVRSRTFQRWAKLASKTLDYCSFWAVAPKNVPIVTSRINIVQGWRKIWWG